MKLVVGQEYDVFTGTKSLKLEFLGIAHRNHDDFEDLLVFRRKNPPPELYEYVGAIFEAHYSRFTDKWSEVNVAFRLHATHHGHTIEDMTPHGDLDKWIL